MEKCLICERNTEETFAIVKEFVICSPKCADEFQDLNQDERAWLLECRRALLVIE